VGVKNETEFNNSAGTRLSYGPNVYYFFTKAATSLDALFHAVMSVSGDVVEIFSFFIKLIAAGFCILGCIRRNWSRALLLKTPKLKLWTACIGAAIGILAVLSAVQTASAAPCDLKNNPPAFVRHDLTSSYCELCGYGYITIVVSNPYQGVDMTDMTVVENLNSSGLTFDPTAPMPVTYRVNGGALLVGSAPLISGANGSILTWTSTQIPDLGRLAYQPGNNAVGTIAITFSVTRAGGLSQEGLVSATRLIEANLTYSTDEICFSGSRKRRHTVSF